MYANIVQEVNQYDNFYFEVCNEPLVAQAGFEPLDDFATTEEIDDWQRAIRISSSKFLLKSGAPIQP